MEQILLRIVQRARHDNSGFGYLALGSGILCLSIAPIIVRVAAAPGIVTSFYRMLLTTLIMIPLFLLSERRRTDAAQPAPRFSWKVFILPVLAGVSSALDHTLWASAVHLTHISNATLLNSISPVWVSLFAYYVLHEKMGKQFWLGLVIVLVGVAGISGVTLATLREGLSQGDLLAFISSIFYAGYFTFTELGRRHYNAVRQMMISLIFCTLTIGLILLWRQIPIFGYSRGTYGMFVLIALVSQLGGYFSLTYALGKLPASIVSPAIEIQPVISSLLAMLFLGEAFGVTQAVSCAAILSGIYLINRSRGTKTAS